LFVVSEVTYLQVVLFTAQVARDIDGLIAGKFVVSRIRWVVWLLFPHADGSVVKLTFEVAVEEGVRVCFPGAALLSWRF